MTCQKKNKKSLVYCLLLQLCLVVVIPLLLSVNSYASETTLQKVDDYFKEHNFYETCAYVCRKYASFPYTDYITGANSGIAYDAFAQYLEDHGKSSLLEEDVIITGTGGGRGYDIPQDVRQEMLNFVQDIYINEHSLSYSEAYLNSYNNVNASWFPNYQLYSSFKTWAGQQNGYIITFQRLGNGSIQGIDCLVIPKTNPVNFVGTTTSGGFTNVQLYIGWSTSNTPWQYASGITWTRFNLNGTTTTGDYSAGKLCSTVGNTARIHDGTTSRATVFTNLPKNELVYVFSTLNALKNYNAGNPDPYYMPTNSQTTVPYYDGFTQSDLNSAGNFYNNIVINTEGATPTDKKKTVDNVLGSLGSMFGGGEDTENGGGLLGGLADIITGATGAISPIKEIVLGDIKALIEDTFSWLPPTIITIWIAGISFGVFFGVLKLIRG